MTDFSISADFGCFDRMRMRVGRDRVSKHYPRKGTETCIRFNAIRCDCNQVSKHYPRKGTETSLYSILLSLISTSQVSKHYPRKGTETPDKDTSS